MGELARGFTSASNVFISIGLELGIFALAAFVFMLIVRVRHRTIYHGYIKHSEISMISPIIAVATIGIIVFGTTSNVLGDAVSYYLFWCVFGAGSATLRVAKREYDERVMYFEDAIDRELSVVDVKII
jgi:O-antigen ligase